MPEIEVLKVHARLSTNKANFEHIMTWLLCNIYSALCQSALAPLATISRPSSIINPNFFGLGNLQKKLGILKIVGKNWGNFKVLGGKSALIHLVTLERFYLFYSSSFLSPISQCKRGDGQNKIMSYKCFTINIYKRIARRYPRRGGRRDVNYNLWTSPTRLSLHRCWLGTTSTTSGWRSGSRTRATRWRTQQISSQTWWVAKWKYGYPLWFWSLHLSFICLFWRLCLEIFLWLNFSHRWTEKGRDETWAEEKMP